MTTYPLPTLGPTVDDAGISIPTYNDIYQSLISSFKSIYGSDLYVAPDSQDGQLIAIFAKAIHDSNQAAVAVFQSFSPTYAQGAGLSSVVKINGIQRLVASNSTVDLTLVGQVGTVINNGQASDINKVKWNLPALVTIPISGSTVVTATCNEPGAITALIGTITKIATPTLGWQSVTNASAAAPGNVVELDSELKLRQKVSTAIPSESILDGTIGAVANIPGVTRFKGYENDTNLTDADGLPPHNIAIVAEGGIAADIANAIAVHKTPGTPTYGTTSITVYDNYGMPNVINFFRPTAATISVEITITEFTGFTNAYNDQIKQSVVDYLLGLQIGDDILLTKLYVPANLPGTEAYGTYDISLIRIKKNAGAFGTSNLTLAFNEIASCSISDVTIL